jgi:hypothetical protein
MGQLSASMDRDQNRVPVQSNEAFRTVKRITFDGSEGNGAIGTIRLFNFEGAVLVNLLAHVVESFVDAGTSISVGFSGDPAGLIPATTGNGIQAGYVGSVGGFGLSPGLPDAKMYGSGVEGIDLIVETANATDGTIEFYVLWRPLSSDGSVRAA